MLRLGCIFHICLVKYCLVIFRVQTDWYAVINNLLLQFVKSFHSFCWDFLRWIEPVKHDVADDWDVRTRRSRRCRLTHDGFGISIWVVHPLIRAFLNRLFGNLLKIQRHLLQRFLFAVGLWDSFGVHFLILEAGKVHLDEIWLNIVVVRRLKAKHIDRGGLLLDDWWLFVPLRNYLHVRFCEILELQLYLLLKWWVEIVLCIFLLDFSGAVVLGFCFFDVLQDDV